METGQFLYMKYRVGMRKNKAITSGDGSCMITAITSNTILKSKTKPKRLGKESLSNLPWQLKKPYLLSNLTLCIDLIIKGTLKIVAQNITPAISPSSLKYCDTAVPMVIPSQNIIFQKLSLLSRAFIQFIVTYVFRVYNRIVTTLKLLLKKIKSVALIAVIIFLNPVANAQGLKSLISDIEKQYSIPQGLLHSIALVESQMNPHAINVEGKAIISSSKTAALKVIEHYRSLGVTNIDIGVMQINYRWHGKEFTNLSEMLEVNNNIEYAAKLLSSLYKEHGSWHKATRLYHSATPKYHKQYSKKIITAWLRN